MGRGMLDHPEYRRMVRQSGDRLSQQEMVRRQMIQQQAMGSFGNVFGLGAAPMGPTVAGILGLTSNVTECSTLTTSSTCLPAVPLAPPCTGGLDGRCDSTGQATIPYEVSPWPGGTQLEMFERPKPPPPPAPRPIARRTWLERTMAKLPRIKWGDSDEEQS